MILPGCVFFLKWGTAVYVSSYMLFADVAEWDNELRFAPHDPVSIAERNPVFLFSPQIHATHE